MGKVIQTMEHALHALEEYIETFRLYRQIGFIRRKAAVMQAYVYREHHSTNAINQ